MTNFQRTFTTPDQSRRLLGLGLPADSADGFNANVPKGFTDVDVFLIHANETYTQRIAEIIDHSKERRTGVKKTDYLPCWSVGRLIEIDAICHKAKETRWTITKHTNILELVYREMVCSIRVGDYDFSKLEE